MFKPAPSFQELRHFSLWRARLRYLAILSFVVYLIVWNIPANVDDKLKVGLRSIFEPVALYLGLWQDWRMFAPDPMDMDIYVEALVVMRDGSQKVFEFPRMAELSIADRYQQERFRKFAAEHLRKDDSRHLWHPAAQFVARKFAREGFDPQRVSLIRRWRQVPAIEVDQNGKIKNQVGEWESLIFYSREYRARAMGDES